MTDIFEPERRTIAMLEEHIQAIWNMAKPEIEAYAHSGDRLGERLFVQRVGKQISLIRDEIYYFQHRIPPHIIFKDGVYWKVQQ